jgi:type III restriction enzyme
MSEKTGIPYYKEYKNELHKRLEDIKSQVEPDNAKQLSLNLSPEAAFFKELSEEVTKYPFRFYQKEAIYILHSIYKQAIDVSISPKNVQKNLLRQNKYKHIKPLLEEVDKESGRKAPFIGFEMATGSGKTMLMGGAIYYLNKMHNIKNFLIVTPSSLEIYKKTIRNFQKDTHETVWNDDVPFNFNLITGDNYKDTKDLFHSETDANIFVFNIDKFGANATQTKKEWEGSIWRDNNGNTVSLLEYLSQNDLVIITDEAHHAQSRKAKTIINTFKPLAVLEYTATAIETEKNTKKKNQTIVYKYDISRFLEDKYGKIVRVLALPSEEGKSANKKHELSDVERYKLQTFFLVHLLKKKALANDVESRDLKPIGFVKVKNEISFSKKVEEYIKNELALDTTSLEVILDKAKAEDTETTNLILEMFENDYDSDISKLQKEIHQVAQKAILYHSKSDKLVQKKFNDIQRNDVEIVIFIDILNEGIDMNNIYSMVVINDKPTEFKTSVKQIVGRGVRLNKPEREYDDVQNNELLTHTEKLHIICDKGASFEDVILQIQKEFGLNDKTFAMERGEEKVIENIPNEDKLEGIKIPKIKIDFKRKEGVKIMDVIENYDKIIEDFLSSNSFAHPFDTSSNSRFLAYAPNSFFIEVDLFKFTEREFHFLGENQNWNYDRLEITEKDMKEVYGRVVSKLKAIPDVPKTYKIFQEYGRLINARGLYFYNLDEVDYKLAINRFKDSFTYFYINYVENEYFELDSNTLDSETDTWWLQNEFKPEKIKVRRNDIENNSRFIEDKNQLVDLIKTGHYFYGYKHSIYNYEKFDSYPEKQLADYVDYLIEQEPDKAEPFWVKNERNIYFEYGPHKYFPDFIFFYNKIIYVIEIKGEAFSSVKKNKLLFELNNVEGIGKVDGYVGMVVFEIQMKNLQDFTTSFETFRKEAEEYFKIFQRKAKPVSDNEVEEEKKFKQYVPVYSPKQAYEKIINQKEPKSFKWIDVNFDDYSESVFATNIKDNVLGSELKGGWLLMTSEINDPSEIKGETVLCYHPSIDEGIYGKNLTIKKFDFKEETYKEGLFNETSTKVILYSDDESELIELSNLSDFKVIGVMIGLC